MNSESRSNDIFSAEEYSQLADVIRLNEEVPDHLKKLWEHVAENPESLARLEEFIRESRMISEILMEERARLVISVAVLAKAIKVQLRSQSGPLGPLRSIDYHETHRGAGPSSSSLVFDDFAIEVDTTVDTVRLTVFTSLDASGIEVQAIDLKGEKD